MRLVNLPALRWRAAETLSHSGLSVAHAVVRSRPDVAFVFNAANAPYLPVLRAGGIPVAVNVDGLEWRRAKWAGAGARYYRWAERSSVSWADAVIADSVGIADHLRDTHGVEPRLIPYGAAIVHPGSDRLGELRLLPHRYHLVVSRFEPENHVLEMVQGYLTSTATHPLVVVGSSPYSLGYVERVRSVAVGDRRVRLLGSFWDQGLLDQLYAGALSHLHGHSVGGTSPSLLRALGAGAPVTAHDNVFTREVTGGHARFFTDVAGVAVAVIADEADPDAARDRGRLGRDFVAERYRWDDVAGGYEALAVELRDRRRGGARR
jgi:glycosyltransferase involved in cell wall biosynthesis